MSDDGVEALERFFGDVYVSTLPHFYDAVFGRRQDESNVVQLGLKRFQQMLPARKPLAFGLKKVWFSPEALIVNLSANEVLTVKLVLYNVAAHFR